MVTMENNHVDPLTLLKAMSSMLTHLGAIKGANEMEKLVQLMKDGKLLVSRCVYLNILRVTEEKDLLEKFLAEGGWQIMNQWLVDAKDSENLALVLEVMKLLQRLPLRIDHLKENNTPKLVKAFAKSASCPKVKNLASSLMTSWLAIIRDSSGATTTDDMTKKKKFKTKPPLDRIPKKEAKKAKTDSKPPPIVKAPSFAKFRKTGLETDQEPLKRVLKGEKKGIATKRNSIENDDASIPDKKLKTDTKQPKKITISAGFMDALNSVPAPAVKRPVKRKAASSKPKTPNATSQAQKLSPGHDASVSGEAADFGVEMAEKERVPSPVIPPTEPSKPKLNKYGKPMKTVRWHDDSRLESIRYFELEEGERVNVTTQNFKDALHRDRLQERERMGGFHPKGDGDWKKPKLIDLPAQLVEIGCNSLERELQNKREKSVLQVIFLTPDMIPDCPVEPDPEPYEMIPPKMIPLDDPNEPAPVTSTPSPTPEENPDVLTNMISTVVGNGSKTSDEHIKDKLREIIQTATGKTPMADGSDAPGPDIPQAPVPWDGMQPQQMMPNGGDPNMMFNGPPPGMVAPGANGYFPSDPNMMMGPPNMMPHMMNNGAKWPRTAMGHPHNRPNMPPNMRPMNMRHNGPPQQFQPRMRPREPWRGLRPRRGDFRGRWNIPNRGNFRR
ncbi:unnamed protein product [Clavelina lepadiformis]|uniref:TFIIS N-terminal domain-containing protein n=1 Tax=Clavelina lepadiformis TaxID=159417 RepID=A0ABP0F6K0_CLALP